MYGGQMDDFNQKAILRADDTFVHEQMYRYQRENGTCNSNVRDQMTDKYESMCCRDTCMWELQVKQTL